MSSETVTELNWQSPELRLITPDSFPAYYPPRIENPFLERALRGIGGNSIEQARGYGSAFNGDAAKDSLMDIILIVRNPWTFYEQAAASGNVKLGTSVNAGFHALWNYNKTNFYLGTISLGNFSQGIKLAVISHDELSKHARGGRPGVDSGKGFLYLSGRLHKAMLPIILDDTIPEEQRTIDCSINQARIDGVWLALGLLPRWFDFDQLADTYVNLSYAADKRVEKANKSRILLDKNYIDYQQMLDPILNRFETNGLIGRIEGRSDLFEKKMSLAEKDVRKWLKESAAYAFKVNFFQNIWTMGFLNGVLYGLAKFRRVRG